MNATGQMRIILCIEMLLNFLLIFLFVMAVLCPAQFSTDLAVFIAELELNPREETLFLFAVALIFGICILLSLAHLALLLMGYRERSMTKLRMWSFFTIVGLGCTILGLFFTVVNDFEPLAIGVIFGDIIYAAYSFWALLVVNDFGKELKLENFERTFQSAEFTRVTTHQ